MATKTTTATNPATPSKNSPQRPRVLEAEAILGDLTTRQHVRPHMALRAVLAGMSVCPVAAERAIEWLGLDGDTAVGRVKRAELIQLARSLHRFWSRATAAGVSPSL
jgi:hypothetical protein